ncbi:hypothetical protein QR680_012725 [Steinernema hermaphroditum]|uniref:Uncharacterized protein n=1 Tax=Steinernema hermaphroditum TaxID=289476 RepID=A0AA39I4B0_9BILA|nr:hypothetical protein QR680_012725 [Steinernema hermaphroditum]
MLDVRLLQREVVQRNFANLLKNGHLVGKEMYSFRRFSLNECFTLMYRGYVLREAQQAEAPDALRDSGRRPGGRRKKRRVGEEPRERSTQSYRRTRRTRRHRMPQEWSARKQKSAQHKQASTLSRGI